MQALPYALCDVSRVYARVRPLGKHEGSEDVCVVTPDDTTIIVEDKDDKRGAKRPFEFNAVFGMQSTQEDVFRDTEPLLTSVLDGYNVCIFAYGQSGKFLERERKQKPFVVCLNRDVWEETNWFPVVPPMPYLCRYWEDIHHGR